MKRIVFIILALLLLCGCTPQRKLARLVKKYPELITRVDTLVIRDSVIRAGEYKEIMITLPSQDSISKGGDKIAFVETSSAQAGLFFVNDTTLKLFIEQYPDTLLLDTAVIVPTYNIQSVATKQSKYSWFDKVLFTIIIIAFFMLFLLFIRGLLTNKLLR